MPHTILKQICGEGVVWGVFVRLEFRPSKFIHLKLTYFGLHDMRRSSRSGVSALFFIATPLRSGPTNVSSLYLSLTILNQKYEPCTNVMRFKLFCNQGIVAYLFFSPLKLKSRIRLMKQKNNWSCQAPFPYFEHFFYCAVSCDLISKDEMPSIIYVTQS